MAVNRDKGYDGIVLESWSRWAAYGVLDDPELRYMVLHLSLCNNVVLTNDFAQSCLDNQIWQLLH